MEYFFVLGRNPELSYAEIISYLKSRNFSFEKVLFKSNLLVVSIKENFEFDIQEFGGLLKIGKMYFRGNKKEFSKFLENYIVEKNKFSYSVMGDNIEDLEEKLAIKFRQERVKAQIRRGYNQLKLQEQEAISITNADYEFFYYEINQEIYFGIVEQNYSYKEIKERDMKKPVRRESLAISPRLAKIMINLSQIKKNQNLLDPFCGVGGVIQEALIKNINCYGIDKDKEAIFSAKKNLSWLCQKYNISAKYKLFNIDSKEMPKLKIEGVASEPHLGDLKKRKLTDQEANKFIQDFEFLIVPILKKIKENKTREAKVVLTMPYIRNFSVNIDKITRLTGLKLYELKDIKVPIKEFREDQFVSREIVILE